MMAFYGNLINLINSYETPTNTHALPASLSSIVTKIVDLSVYDQML
jgi:hypothetical protein